MNFSFPYLFLFLFLTTKLFCQDVLVKKDSSKIEVKVLEVRTNELKYKLFTYLDGPDIIISKKEVAYVIYANGVKEIFNISNTTEIEQVDSFYLFKPTIWQGDTSRLKRYKEPKLSDYININFDVGIVVNDNYANKPRSNYIRLGSQGSPESETYSVSQKKQMEYGYSIGFNFLAGKSPYVKHLIGINYLKSTGEFIFEHSLGYYDNQTQTSIGYTKKATYRSTVHYGNFQTGIRFIIYKRLCLDNIISVNIPFKTINKVNGYETNSRRNYSSNNVETYYFNDEITHDSKVKATFSLAPKLSYEFNAGPRKFGIYLSYNISYKYELPWYMAGITYYPFKKLSRPIEMKNLNSNGENKKNLKIIQNPKLNFDIGTVANNGYTNTDEAYSGKKPENPKEYKLGYNFGMNFHHGKSSYFKHFVLASLIESEAKLLKRTYNYTYDLNYTYETVNTTQYASRVLFFNIGTGIKFVMFKHLYFDNGLALNIPIYSTNEIQYNKTYNQWDKFRTTKINSVSDPTIKNKSNEFLLKKTHLILLAKIGYEFNIKQNRFGAFIGWNYNLNKIGQWHLIGITYYPFKKLK